VDPGFALIWIVGCLCAVGAAWQAKFHRYAGLILMAGAGLASCVGFVWLSAPDLALTQLLVEGVTTVLLLLGLRWLPQRRAEIARSAGRQSSSQGLRRVMDLAIAIAAGAGMALLSYAVMTRPPATGIAGYFLENAYPGGGGKNVVNVILVDFRAFDTLGEITVLAIVGLTVLSLLRRFRPAAESIRIPEQQRVQNAFDDRAEGRAVGDTRADYLVIPRIIMQWLSPVILVFAIYLLLRGHDLPGGGFIAGVTLAMALLLQYMAFGTRGVDARLRVRPLSWVGLGLLIALVTGAGAWLFGHPFLTSAFGYAAVPVIGAVPLASALLFDVGVFLVVIGVTALILTVLAHQSIRTPRLPRASTSETGDS
jgi:multicomponent K+:H+ antiporter subunit A